jgi:hypothetical protein
LIAAVAPAAFIGHSINKFLQQTNFDAIDHQASVRFRYPPLCLCYLHDGVAREEFRGRKPTVENVAAKVAFAAQGDG